MGWLSGGGAFGNVVRSTLGLGSEATAEQVKSQSAKTAVRTAGTITGAEVSGKTGAPPVVPDRIKHTLSTYGHTPVEVAVLTTDAGMTGALGHIILQFTLLDFVGRKKKLGFSFVAARTGTASVHGAVDVRRIVSKGKDPGFFGKGAVYSSGYGEQALNMKSSQVKKLYKIWKKRALKPPGYGLLYSNCATFIEDDLRDLELISDSYFNRFAELGPDVPILLWSWLELDFKYYNGKGLVKNSTSVGKFKEPMAAAEVEAQHSDPLDVESVATGRPTTTPEQIKRSRNRD